MGMDAGPPGGGRATRVLKAFRVDSPEQKMVVVRDSGRAADTP